MIQRKSRTPALLLLCSLMACGRFDSAETDTTASVDPASETETLASLLDEFLAGASVNDAAVHDRFWSEDLVYTSSNGTRRGKAEIMAGLAGEEASGDSGPGVVYTAEDVEIDLYGTTAVVAFRLVGLPQGDTAEGGGSQYFNTGTFLKREGRWEVVAWQATRIPDSER